MSWPFRVTPPLLDVVQVLTQMDEKVHGWDLAARCGQSTPNVYRVLERLLRVGWVAYEWEAANPEPGKPRRRFYWLTDEGAAQAPRLLAERRDRRKPRGAGVPGIALLGLIVGGGR
ncbi:PadR family transcriptional regulator [Amycolatopsis sp. NPDC021455]|uniref:PadR family transcriptional regulator n=1 Tax=Amycolatopsis sp. NPDC021455 TaxID=3154901 RepID=UPI0033D765E3